MGVDRRGVLRRIHLVPQLLYAPCKSEEVDHELKNLGSTNIET